MDEVIDRLNVYNRSRLHSLLGYVSPLKFEEGLSEALKLEGRIMKRLAQDHKVADFGEDAALFGAKERPLVVCSRATCWSAGTTILSLPCWL